jgi:hypothetical protein
VIILVKIAAVLFLTWAVSVWLLDSREKRGKNLSANPRWFERLVLWRVSRNYRVHIHHAYWAIALIAIKCCLRDYFDILLMTLIVLILSDVIFHYFAHKEWGDPRWDVIIDNQGNTVFWK